MMKSFIQGNSHFGAPEFSSVFSQTIFLYIYCVPKLYIKLELGTKVFILHKGIMLLKLAGTGLIVTNTTHVILMA